MDSNQVAVENIAEALFSAKYQKPAYVTAIAQNDLNKQFAFEEKLSEERVLILREKLKSNSFSGSKDVTEILNQVEELEKADKYYEIIKKLIEPFIFNYETAKKHLRIPCHEASRSHLNILIPA